MKTTSNRAESPTEKMNMENLNNTASEILEKALDAANGWYKATDDADRVAKIVAAIGTMNRDEYLALRSLWRARYRELSVESRLTKPQRKGGNEKAANRVLELREQARRHMAVRHALKACARAHAEATRVKAA
jgi:hypothetical protein